MYEREDTTTLSLDRITSFSDAHELSIDESIAPPSTLSASLAVSVQRAFTLFCASGRASEWMTVVRSSQVLSRNEWGLPLRTAFLAQMERATMGYTLEYQYDLESYKVRWATSRDAHTLIQGEAKFHPLGPVACMMHYQLQVHSETQLPAWGSTMYDGHPASAVISDFREFVSQQEHAALYRMAT